MAIRVALYMLLLFDLNRITEKDNLFESFSVYDGSSEYNNAFFNINVAKKLKIK